MKEKNLTIEYIKINNLIPYKNNPRINDKAAEIVAESIKNFGFKNPIIIDKNNVIIAGHTRLKAAIKLELEEVPTIKIEDLTEEQIKAFRIADNKTNEYAEWDMNLLTNELKEIGDVFSGFDFKELQKLLPEKSAEEDDYEIEVPDEPKSRLGEVYQLGNHRLMCGDSTKLKDVGRLIDQKIDLVVTDPPYNVNYGSKADAINKYGYNFSDRKIANDYMPSLEFLRFLDETFFNMKEHMKDGAAFYIWHASTTVYEFEEALKKK